ncbi:MAG: hypothetical protein R2939_16280 [Kofleriaceae bacterium]
MSRSPIREVAARLGHIDGELVSVQLGWPEEGTLAVRYYPWFEHPRVREANAAGRPWRAEVPDEAHQVLRIHPRGLREIALTAPVDCTELFVAERSARHWPHEPTGQVVINAALPAGALEAACAELLGELAPHALEFVGDALAPAPPLSLRWPASLHACLVRALEQSGTAHLVTSTPAAAEPLVTLGFGDGSYLIAEDFEVELPTFEFRDDWVKVG